jgi:hypothetical protein
VVSPGTLGRGGSSTSGAEDTGGTGSGRVHQGGCDASPAPTHILRQQVLVCKDQSLTGIRI